jgi:hypothetical protein
MGFTSLIVAFGLGAQLAAGAALPRDDALPVVDVGYNLYQPSYNVGFRRRFGQASLEQPSN